MTLRQIRKFRFTCDGYKPNGKRCPCNLTVEAWSHAEAEKCALDAGWYQDHPAWICSRLHEHL